MTESESASIGQTLAEAFATVEAEPETRPKESDSPAAEQSTEQPSPQPQAESTAKTDADKWRDALNAQNFKSKGEANRWARANCTDEKVLKAVYGENWQEKGLQIGAVGTAYRITGKMKFGNRPSQESRTCTFKIKKEELPDQPPEPVPVKPNVLIDDPEPVLPPPTPVVYPPTPTTAQPAQLSEQLLGKAARTGWNALCDFSEAPDAYLSKEEAAELAEYLHPVVQSRFPQIANNPEVVAVLGAGSILAPKAKLLMDARKRKKQEQALLPEVHNVLPPPKDIDTRTGEPIPPPEPEQPKPEEQPDADVQLKEGRPKFYSQLGK
jgi:hypothetical protein